MTKSEVPRRGTFPNHFSYKVKTLVTVVLFHLTDTPGLSDTPCPQENFRFGRNLVQVESRPNQVTTK